MNLALTGATGFVGSHVLAELREHGHQVTALVRDDSQAEIVAARGAAPRVVDLYDKPTVAAAAVGAPGAVPGSDDEARARLGDYFAEVLLLYQATDAARARDELGWHPTRPGLVDDLRNGSYRQVTTS